MNSNNSTFYIENPDDKNKLVYIYELYKKKLIIIAMSYLHNQYDAEDAVEQTYEKVAKNMSLIDDPDSVQTKALLSVITKNNALNMIKERKRTDYLEDIPEYLSVPSKDSVERSFEQKEHYKEILDDIKAMSDIYKNALILKYVNGHNIGEISNILGIGYHAAAKRVERGEKMLRDRLKKRGVVSEE